MKCSHYFQPVNIDSQTVIYCSSLNNSRDKNSLFQPMPDFGLYADYKWHPTWRNEFINWPDFSVPKDPIIASQQIVDAVNRASISKVEIGCIGGHGRTGTILACMLIKKTCMNTDQAIFWVKNNYCSHAIETRDQELFIEFFRKVTVDGELWDNNKLFMEY